MVKRIRDKAAAVRLPKYDVQSSLEKPVAAVLGDGKKAAMPVASQSESRVKPFGIISSAANSSGSVTVCFSAQKDDAPDFWFENGTGNIFPVLPSILERAAATGINLLRSNEVNPDWALTESDAAAELGRNLSPIWTLEGAETFYISAPRTENDDQSELSVVLCDPVTHGLTPIKPSADYRFSILAAVHRCTAWAEIACLSGKGETLSRDSRKVDAGFLGGVSETDYDQVELEFRSPPDATQLKISVFKGPTTQTEDGFVFFANPVLAESPIANTVAIVPNATLEQMKRNQDLMIFSAQLPVSAELCRGRKRSVTLTVAIGNERRQIPNLDVRWNSPVQIDHCWLNGRDVRFTGFKSADDVEPTRLGVFVDGDLSVEGDISEAGAFECNLSLSARHLDGRPHGVEIRTVPEQFHLAHTFGFVPFYLTPWTALQEYAKSPFSLTASPAAAYHHRSYRAWVQNADGRDLRGIAVLGDELVQGFRKRAVYPPIVFPKAETPQVSVIIPVHNKFEVTYFCLCSLLFAYNDASFEVIIVDDGSTDATLKLEEFVSGVSVIRHSTALGFVDSCNEAALIARGEYIFLLNNDTEVTAGSIDALLKVFKDFDNIGLAGSKLLYPDGKLQEAGGIIWRSGNPWNFGRNENAYEPQYSYLRQVDYISGAAILVNRKVWEEVGGFSKEFAPAYYEDADLAMKIRDTGRYVVFVPSSIIFHFEGQSAGTSVDSGMKRFQAINNPKFRRKWARLYAPNGVEGVRADLEKDRGVSIRVLMLDHAFPQVDSDAGSYAALQEIRLLQSLGAKVTFLPRNLAWMDRHTRLLEDIGVECLYAPFVMDVENYLQNHAADYDLFYVTRFKIAEELSPFIRRYAPRSKIILNLADLHFLRELREASTGSPDYSFGSAVETRDAELRAIESVDLTLTYTDVEATVIQSHLSGVARVSRVPWVVDTNGSSRPEFSSTQDILFLGGFAHYPNVESVKFFVRSIMPALREHLPNVRFRIAGSRPTPDVLSLESDGVEIVGYVRDLDALFASARVYVAPLLAGAGIKGKVIEGMARGVPSVLSPVAVEGTGLTTGVDCFVARTVDEWVAAIVKLYTDEDLWNSMGDAAKDGARRRFSFSEGQNAMREALAMVEIFAHSAGLHFNRARP